MTEPARPAPRLAPEERRRQLLAVACEAFADRGFHATAMDDLAAAAGITKPVFYQHFPSKRALFVAVLQDVGARLSEVVHDAAQGATTARERVEAGFAAYFRFVEHDRAAFRILFGSSVRNDPEFADVVDQALERIATTVGTMIELDASAEHRRVLAHAVVGMAESVGRLALAGGETARDPAAAAHWVAELAWFGLRGIRAEE